MLNYEFPPLGGGASPVSYEIAKRLSEKKGISVDVVTMGFRGLKKIEKVSNDLRIYRVRSFRRRKEVCSPLEQLSYLLSAFLFCKKLIEERQYDICHCHFLVPTGLLAYLLKRKYGLRYVVTSHGSDIPGFNADRFKFLHRFTGPLLRRIAGDSDLITVPSNYLKKLIFCNVKNVKSEKILVLPNGSKSFEDKTVKKENMVLSVGRLLPRKGFQYLIRAFKRLNNKNWKLYIVGDGPYRKKLEKIAGKNENIIFTGWLNNDEKRMKVLYNQAKVFSLLSSSESQGIAFLEAMSTSCAIIASKSSACLETVTPETGYLVSREDVDEVSLRLESLFNNPSKIERFSRGSRQRFEKVYCWESIIEQYKMILSLRLDE